MLPNEFFTVELIILFGWIDMFQLVLSFHDIIVH